jgi:hypothetical protein
MEEKQNKQLIQTWISGLSGRTVTERKCDRGIHPIFAFSFSSATVNLNRNEWLIVFCRTTRNCERSNLVDTLYLYCETTEQSSIISILHSWFHLDCVWERAKRCMWVWIFMFSRKKTYLGCYSLSLEQGTVKLHLLSQKFIHRSQCLESANTRANIVP